MTKNKTKLAIIALCAMMASGCSNGPSLSTGSLFGSEKKAAQKTTTPLYRNDPTARAMQVSSTSARAVKCGYNFDPAALKAKFLASESALGAPVAQLASIEKMYDITNRGIVKAIGPNKDYCSPAKTKKVKADLTRHLAGDYTPPKPKKVAVKADGGLFGGFLDGDSTNNSGPKYGSSEWWDKQAEQAGK